MRKCHSPFSGSCPSRYHFLKGTSARIQGTFFPKRKGESKLKQDCFDHNKFMVPFDYTDTEQRNIQEPQSKSIDAMLSKLTSLLDHINP